MSTNNDPVHQDTADATVTFRKIPANNSFDVEFDNSERELYTLPKSALEGDDE